jgi:amphi-Trp domain-containing protein
VRLDAHRDGMTAFEYEERLPRQLAAERLADIAYALTAGETLEQRRAGEQVSVPIADEVLLLRRSTSKGDRIDVEIRLSWSAANRADPAAQPAAETRPGL